MYDTRRHTTLDTFEQEITEYVRGKLIALRKEYATPVLYEFGNFSLYDYLKNIKYYTKILSGELNHIIQTIIVDAMYNIAERKLMKDLKHKYPAVPFNPISFLHKHLHIGHQNVFSLDPWWIEINPDEKNGRAMFDENLTIEKIVCFINRAVAGAEAEIFNITLNTIKVSCIDNNDNVFCVESDTGFYSNILLAFWDSFNTVRKTIFDDKEDELAKKIVEKANSITSENEQEVAAFIMPYIIASFSQLLVKVLGDSGVNIDMITSMVIDPAINYLNALERKTDFRPAKMTLTARYFTYVNRPEDMSFELTFTHNDTQREFSVVIKLRDFASICHMVPISLYDFDTMYNIYTAAQTAVEYIVSMLKD